MAYKRKFKKGEKITSLDELSKQEFIYFFDKITHNGWFMSWQFRSAKMYLDRGCLYYALPNDMRKQNEKMKIDVKELYENERLWWDDYQPMLDAFGKIAIQVDDDDYQGDSRLLYDENGKIGILIFGWGSCSGCDALQGCGSLEEVQELCDELQGSIKWFDDKKQALEYFTNHDWQGDYSWYQTETKEFINKCIEYLSAAHPTEKGGAE